MVHPERIAGFVGVAAVSAMCVAAVAQPRTTDRFNRDWRFHLGDVQGGQSPSLDDARWILLDLPHDWSIEGRSHSAAEQEDSPELHVVSGEWRFHKGDDLLWKRPDTADRSWQVVTLPATWEQHSDYTDDNVYGWYRRDLTVAAQLEGRDIFLNLGKIDDTDETYFNGVKVGGLGHMPPAYVSAWDIVRRYKVPHDIIHYGAKNSIAVRVFDGIQGGGIYAEGEEIFEGPFSSASPGGSGAGYIDAGTGWYRKTFSLPRDVEGRRVFIELDGVYMNSDVWINGTHLGSRPYGYSSFQYELTPHLKLGDQKNVLAVRVNVQQPCTRWYSGAGIYRNVRLVITSPVHIGHWGTYVTTSHVSAEEATVRVTTAIQNDSPAATSATLETVLLDSQGREVANGQSRQRLDAESSGVFEQLLSIRKPILWSLETPTLYRVRSRVRANGDLVDATETPFGIRTIEFTRDKGFFLNGKHVDIRGVCLHHDLGCLGAAVRSRAIERQLEIMKSMGANAIRTSHNPPARELLDLCDRMGLLVMDEAFDEWKRSKTMFGYGRFFDEWSQRDLADMIRRDRNHPSVIMWSTGNEIPEQDNANGHEMSKRLADIVHALDPTRPVTAACNTPEAAVRTGFAKPLDVLGINYSMPFYLTAKGAAKLVASETTSAVSTRGEYNLVLDGESVKVEAQLANQCSSYNDATAATTIEALRDAPWVAGQFAWTGFDYIGEPSPFSWPSVSSYFGIVDRCGFPKDRYYLYQSQWADEPMVHILPHWSWQGFEGRGIPVWCYSNCDSVELFLNGRSLGEKTTRDAEDLRLEWRVPYSAGTLRAVARRDGEIVATEEVHTAGSPARIVLRPDRTELGADGEDLSYVKVEIVDRAGRVCPNADNLVKFAIEGEGLIAGVDNGNPISHEHFRASQRKAFHGLCLAVIQATRAPGRVSLTATAEGLEGATVALQTKSVATGHAR